MFELKVGQNIEYLTVEKIVEEYPYLVSKKSLRSLSKNLKMGTKVRISVEKALNTFFDSVKYKPVRGQAKGKTHFICKRYNGNANIYNPDAGKGGSSAFNWTQVDNMIKNQIAKYSNDKAYHSISYIVHDSLKIEYISDAVSSLYENLTGFKTLENGNAKYNIKKLQETLEWFERYQLNNIKKRVKYILENEDIDFKEKYMALKSDGKSIKISPKKYRESEEYKTQITELIKDIKGNSKMDIPHVVSKNINHKFGYINIYPIFSFIDTEKFANEDFDLKEIKLELLRRWYKQGIRKEKKELQKELKKEDQFYYAESFYKDLFKNEEYARLMSTFVKLHLGLE